MNGFSCSSFIPVDENHPCIDFPPLWTPRARGKRGKPFVASSIRRATLASILLIPWFFQFWTYGPQAPPSVMSNSITRNLRDPVLSRQRCDPFPSVFTPTSLVIGFGTMNWKSDSLPLHHSRGFVKQEFTAAKAKQRITWEHSVQKLFGPWSFGT